jgi:hypothetical protein
MDGSDPFSADVHIRDVQTVTSACSSSTAMFSHVMWSPALHAIARITKRKRRRPHARRAITQPSGHRSVWLGATPMVTFAIVGAQLRDRLLPRGALDDAAKRYTPRPAQLRLGAGRDPPPQRRRTRRGAGHVHGLPVTLKRG